MNEMSELEIMNFASDFNNLIKSKNTEIGTLQEENRRLSAVVSQLSKPDRKLTVKEIRDAKRPVYCFRINEKSALLRKGFWAVPVTFGVMNAETRGTYDYTNYEKTWIAFSNYKEIVNMSEILEGLE